MTFDKAKLKALAEDAIGKEPGSPSQFLAWQNMSKMANPHAVLELIAQIERQEIQFKEWQASHHAIYCGVAEERDQLKAENEALRGLYQMHKQTETREMRELKAELAGLKTGYEAYERVNAELRAECEALRKDAGRYRWLRVDDVEQYEISTRCSEEKMDAAIDAALSKEHSHD